MKRTYILLGGFWGFDGRVTSAGMYSLANILKKIPNMNVSVYSWSSYRKAIENILKYQEKDEIILIGYSGGGSRATWIANDVKRPKIDLMILYDPSPKWQMLKIGKNVKQAVCYENDIPFIFGLGCGKLIGENVTTYRIHQPHISVQNNMNLHRMTTEMVAKL